MKKLFILLLFLLSGYTLFAQDIITKKDGTDIKAKVTEVGQSQITYKKFSNLEGPTYTLNIADILMITYENGEREVYVDNKPNEKSSLPQGVMTYNSWSGKVSIGGTTIENEMLDKYFTPEDLKMFSLGKSISLMGGLVGIAGSFPFGWGLGYMIGGGEPNPGLLIGGGVAILGGLLVSALGDSQRKKAINNYNSSLAFSPKVHFGATSGGLGLALVF